MSLLEHFALQLDDLKKTGNLRQFKSNVQNGQWIELNGKRMLNLSSNDYLGIASNAALQEEFFDTTPASVRRLSSSSSRLLTGNFPEYEQLEHNMGQLFQGQAVLLFNSGYHMNIGILPAVSDANTLILSDKLVHASIIDGIRLGKAKYLRYRHNDLLHLDALIQQYQNDASIHRIIVVTESIFSMDGDETDLSALVNIKQKYSNVMLYVDEAHAIGVRGQRGLGCAEQDQVITEIDFLVGTFGKALGSVGGYLVSHPIIRDYLINKMRPLIFSTAQPPICMAWTQFTLNKIIQMQAERTYLADLSQKLQQGIQACGYSCPSSTQIVPVIIGDSQQTLDKAKQVQGAGYYVMPVRPPTVPQGSSRLRICMHSQFQEIELERLLSIL